MHDPWTDKGRFCSPACATAFRKIAYAEAVALRTTGVNAAVLRGQERARAYRESAEYQALLRKSPGDLLRIEQALREGVKP